MRIYLKKNPAEFHRDSIWKDRALDFFEVLRPKKNKNNKISSDMGSVPDPKILRGAQGHLTDNTNKRTP